MPLLFNFWEAEAQKIVGSEYRASDGDREI
jgi:hypothetical protein